MTCIEKIFHQIWINKLNPELPDKYKKYRDTWMKFHPEWQYKLWNLESIDFDLRRGDLLTQCSHYAQMADVLRYEILLKYGGVYIDTDFECIKSIDNLIVNVKNFASSEDGVYLTNAIIGAEKNSLYIDRLLNALPIKLGLKSIPEETGPVFFTKCIVGGGISSDFCIFPRKYFYPYLYNETHRANESFPEAYAIHRWDHSWKGGILSRVKQKIKKII